MVGSSLTFVLYSCVQRPTQVKIRAQDLDGKRMEVAFEGWPARIFQHEFDHLQVVSLFRGLYAAPLNLSGLLIVDMS